MNKEKEKSWKEYLVDLPLIGWFFGIVFRILGVGVAGYYGKNRGARNT